MVLCRSVRNAEMQRAYGRTSFSARGYLGAHKTRVGIYTSFGPSIPVYTCIYTDTRIYGLNTYDD